MTTIIYNYEMFIKGKPFKIILGRIILFFYFVTFNKPHSIMLTSKVFIISWVPSLMPSQEIKTSISSTLNRVLYQSRQ
jgi:hypothetical protein